MASTINGFSVGYTVGGAILLWSGLTGKTVQQTFQSVVSGSVPSAPAAPVSSSGTAVVSNAAPSVSGTYTVPELESLWTSQGGSPSTAFIAAQVAMSESSGNPNATSSNPDGGTNVGLWQLDTRGVGSGYTVSELMNPAQNAAITVLATHNGTSWTEWADSVVQNGVYVGPTG